MGEKEVECKRLKVGDKIGTFCSLEGTIIEMITDREFKLYLGEDSYPLLCDAWVIRELNGEKIDWRTLIEGYEK